MKKQSTDLKLFTPESSHDLEEIGEILQTYESSIIVNLSKSKCKKELIDKSMQFIESYNTSYMIIKTKKIFTRVFICYSQQNKLLV